MVGITLLYRGEAHQLEVEVEEGVEQLRVQIYSITRLLPHEQSVTGLGKGVLSDDTDLSSLQLEEGTWAMVDRRHPPTQPETRPVLPSLPHPAFQPAQPPASRLLPPSPESHRTREMEAQARSVVPWAQLLERAKSQRDSPPHSPLSSRSEAIERMGKEPALIELAKESRGDTARLDSLLRQLAVSQPSILELIQSNSEDFCVFLNQQLSPPSLSAPSPPPKLGMAELRELLRWFKFEFFTWVTAPPCEVTGGTAEACGMGEPTEEERRWGAARVELYRGPQGHITRFPRYNNPGKLLQTRRGRCGEWANCFTLCARAVGFDARWVLDVTDHVWTEVWFEELGKWVHCDPCENVADAPLLYEQGWGKKLIYVFAFELHQCVDVSRRYSSDWEASQKRRYLSEKWLQSCIMALNGHAQAGRTPAECAALRARALLEERELISLASERRAPLKDEEKQGRTTGSLSWRRARGELGSAAGGVARLARICGAVGAVVHGLMFEREGGSREGVFLENSQEPMDLDDDRGVNRRGGIWHEVHADERLECVRGRNSNMGYLCAEVVFELRNSKGEQREIVFAGNQDPDSFGDAWSAKVPPGATLASIEFSQGRFVSASMSTDEDTSSK